MQNIGINEYLNPNIIQFYNDKYDVLRTPDCDENTRLLRAEHGLKYLGNPNHKICRFCGKAEPEVTFKKVAHAFPESIGNKALATYYECDTCNDFFGRTIENEYSKFFQLYHTIMMDSGKNGKREFNFKISCEKRRGDCAKSCVRIGFQDNQPAIAKCIEVEEEFIDITQNLIRISTPIGRCCPIAVYKTLVKMAITIMPVEEVGGFQDAISWILEPKHRNFYTPSLPMDSDAFGSDTFVPDILDSDYCESGISVSCTCNSVDVGKNKDGNGQDTDGNKIAKTERPLLIHYQMIPGFNVTKYPYFILYRRKRTVWDVPYMLFNLTYGCFSLLIEVPRNLNKCDFDRIPFPPIPFHIANEGIWDMSGTEIPKGMKHSVYLNYSGMQPIDPKDIEFKEGKVVLKN